VLFFNNQKTSLSTAQKRFLIFSFYRICTRWCFVLFRNYASRGFGVAYSASSVCRHRCLLDLAVLWRI